MKLQIEYTRKPELGRFPEAIWKEALKDGALVRVEILLGLEEVQEAIEWGRKNNLTFERDGELPSLLASWATLGAHDIDEVELVQPVLKRGIQPFDWHSW